MNMPKFKVSGWAFVPVFVEIEVTVGGRSEAQAEAMKRFKADPAAYVVPNSTDDNAVHDWHPHVIEGPLP
jgi:hypothetical protein